MTSLTLSRPELTQHRLKLTNKTVTLGLLDWHTLSCGLEMFPRAYLIPASPYLNLCCECFV